MRALAFYCEHGRGSAVLRIKDALEPDVPRSRAVPIASAWAQ